MYLYVIMFYYMLIIALLYYGNENVKQLFLGEM